MANTCQNCGKGVKKNESVCSNCGSTINNDPKSAKNMLLHSNDAVGFIKSHSKIFIAVGALALAVVLILLIINPANSPKAVFNRYLDCLHHQNSAAFGEISYDANFSASGDKAYYQSVYDSRFTSADDDYKDNGKVDLLKDLHIKITRIDTPKQSEIESRRAELAADHKYTSRITDIRKITFEVYEGDPPKEDSAQNTDQNAAEGAAIGQQEDENKTIGTAELICVTGKWYIGTVTGI